jgi:hypothetical protein
MQRRLDLRANALDNLEVIFPGTVGVRTTGVAGMCSLSGAVGTGDNHQALSTGGRLLRKS